MIIVLLGLEVVWECKRELLWSGAAHERCKSNHIPALIHNSNHVIEGNGADSEVENVLWGTGQKEGNSILVLAIPRSSFIAGAFTGADLERCLLKKGVS